MEAAIGGDIEVKVRRTFEEILTSLSTEDQNTFMLKLAQMLINSRKKKIEDLENEVKKMAGSIDSFKTLYEGIWEEKTQPDPVKEEFPATKVDWDKLKPVEFLSEIGNDPHGLNGRGHKMFNSIDEVQ